METSDSVANWSDVQATGGPGAELRAVLGGIVFFACEVRPSSGSWCQNSFHCTCES